MSSEQNRYTDEELLFLIKLKNNESLTWQEIANKFNKKFGYGTSSNSLRKLYEHHRNFFDDEGNRINLLVKEHRSKKVRSILSKDNRALLERIDQRQEIEEIIKSAAHEIMKSRVTSKELQLLSEKQQKKKDQKKHMIIEALISDLHIGKKTDTFNLEVAKLRMAEFTHVLISEYNRQKQLYHVDKFILALIGDCIESMEMHNLESAKGCEFGTMKQIHECIILLFRLVIEPVARLGLPIEIPAVTGNHDRTAKERTFNDPGQDNVTYVIYNTLKNFTEIAGYKNVKFYIPKEPQVILDLYDGQKVIYEHFDNAKAPTRQALSNLLANRVQQAGHPIQFMRGGHFHEYTVFGQGTIIANGCLPGGDSYSQIKGYKTDACQAINMYVKTNKRPTCFYKSFPVYLGNE